MRRGFTVSSVHEWRNSVRFDRPALVFALGLAGPAFADAPSIFDYRLGNHVTGPEVELPQGYSFHDFHGNERKEVRLAWWNADAVTWPEATLSVPDPLELPQDAMPADAKSEIYQSDAPPVLVGHYKMKGVPRIEHQKASSIDYPSRPCVYHWSGGPHLNSCDLVKL